MSVNPFDVKTVLHAKHAQHVVTKPGNSTLLWSMLDGVQCRMAAYGDDQCQVILLWHDETIKTTVVDGYADALSTSRRWRHEWDAKASAAAII